MKGRTKAEDEVLDTIIIKDLEIYAHHGVMDAEKEIGQKFIVSLELYVDLRPSGTTDNLDQTISYAQICNEVEMVLLSRKFNLIEACAEEIARHILLKYSVTDGVKVLIKKPWAPIGKNLSYAGVEIERFWHKAFIGIGSNMGDKNANIKKAIQKMETDSVRVVQVSPFYETKPMGPVEQENFINCAAEIKTILTPAELMKFLLDMETEMKRERKVKWGPRTIDLDVLLFDDLILSLDEIIIPHPRMHERLFVLIPLNDIAPNIVHPLLRKRIIEIKSEVEKIQDMI